VAEHAHFDQRERALRSPSQDFVGARWLGRTRRMVVREYRRASMQVERALDDLALVRERLNE
jgi:hypothetical protein